MQDGTILVLETEGEGSIALLSFGVRIPSLQGHVTLFLHPRGHGASEGRWSAENHRSDFEQILTLVRRRYACVIVVAAGELAKEFLLHEKTRGAFPDGMILFRPTPLERLHVQTPTVIFGRGMGHLWNVTVRHWPHQEVAQVHALQRAVVDIAQAERPIRFKAA